MPRDGDCLAPLRIARMPAHPEQERAQGRVDGEEADQTAGVSNGKESGYCLERGRMWDREPLKGLERGSGKM